MQFIGSWATTDRKILLHFSDATLERFFNNIQNRYFDYEAGGILLGSVHGANMLITEATVPTAEDIRSRYYFERLPLGHGSVAMDRWKESQGTIRYLGEWHTHPEDYPSPSGLDRSEWNRLSTNRIDKRPLLAVIVGRRDLYVELVHGSSRGALMVPLGT